MTKAEINVAETISVELFKNMVNGLDVKLRSSDLKKELAYNLEEINKSLYSDFTQVVEVLQNVVNSRWISHYEIHGFQALSLNDFDSCVNHNLYIIIYPYLTDALVNIKHTLLLEVAY